MHRSDAYQASIALMLVEPGGEHIHKGMQIDRGGIDSIVAVFAHTQPT
jgi:hypothetical protein